MKKDLIKILCVVLFLCAVSCIENEADQVHPVKSPRDAASGLARVKPTPEVISPQDAATGQ